MSETEETRNVVRNPSIGVIHLNPDAPHVQPIHDAPVTPLSPSSKYTKSVLTDISDSVFSAVALSTWDNILGPRLQHVWKFPNSPAPKSDLLSHVTRQVLSCEICRDLSNSSIDYKFYNLPDRGVIIPAFIFSAKGPCGLAVHALSLVLPSSELHFYLEIHPVVQCCFQRLVGKLRIILDKNGFQVSMDVFSTYLSDCLKYLSLIHSSSLAHRVMFSDTAFHPDHVLERDFLGKCIASHLMTFGRSLVIGETAGRINLVLYTLSLFNNQSERRCSLPVSDKTPQPYHHDFCLQGLIIKNHNRPYLPMTEIAASQYPTTVIDLASRNVRQTLPYNLHLVNRHETLKNELICLQYGHYEDLIVLEEDFVTVSAFPETFVQIFLEEIFELAECCQVREAYITQFMRILHKKAQCLIECLKAESCDGSQPVKSSGLNKIRNDLHLNMEGDFRIVLAIAEKLRPGIFFFLKGGRRKDFTKSVEIL